MSTTLKHIQSHYISEQPSKLVITVPDKAQGTHQVKVDTHSPSRSEVEHKNHSKKAESNFKDNKLRSAQPVIMVDERHRSEHEIRQFPYILEPTKKDN